MKTVSIIGTAISVSILILGIVLGGIMSQASPSVRSIKNTQKDEHRAAELPEVDLKNLPKLNPDLAYDFQIKLVPIKLRIAAKESVSGYTIQVSSFDTEKEAQDFSKRIPIGKYDSAWVMSAVVKGVVHYRVCIGRFKTLSDARYAQFTVATESGIKEAFVQKIPAHLTASN